MRPLGIGSELIVCEKKGEATRSLLDLPTQFVIYLEKEGKKGQSRKRIFLISERILSRQGVAFCEKIVIHTVTNSLTPIEHYQSPYQQQPDSIRSKIYVVIRKH